MKVPSYITTELNRRGYFLVDGSDSWRGKENEWLAAYVRKRRHPVFLATVSFHTGGAILEILKHEDVVRFSGGTVLPELPEMALPELVD